MNIMRENVNTSYTYSMRAMFDLQSEYNASTYIYVMGIVMSLANGFKGHANSGGFNIYTFHPDRL